MVFDDDEKEKEDGAVSDDAIGEVLEETVDENGEEADPLMAEEEKENWE